MNAPELLATILANRNACVERGEKPTRVFLSRDQYRTVRQWHASLGTLSEPVYDYVGDYRILELDVYDDPHGSLRVE